MLPADLDLAKILAILLIFGCWAAYQPILGLFGRGTLNTQLHVVRQHWMRMLLKTSREHRTFDAVMLGHIVNSVAFFGSATLIVLVGLVGTLASVVRVYAAVRDLHFVAPISVEVFSIFLGVETVILAVSFFSFSYAQRKLAYTLAMIGGLRDSNAESPECGVMIDQTAIVLTEAVKSINNGIRGFYFAVAALFLFGGPWVCIAATLVTTGILYYRQKFSPTARAIERYVDAIGKLAAR